MHRLTSALLLGAGVLLVSYISAPAAPMPEPPRVSAAELAEIDAMVPLAEDLAQETAALRARLAAVPAEPVARRDPFSFGAARRPILPAEPVAPRAEAVVTPEAPPAIIWPTLVAVLTQAGESPVYTAVLGMGEQIKVMTTGAVVDGFQVRAITSSTVELMHVTTATVTALSIR